MEIENKVLLTVSDLRKMLHLGRDRCYDLMHNPAFPSMRIGNRYFVHSKALLKWLDSYQGKEFLL